MICHHLGSRRRWMKNRRAAASVGGRNWNRIRQSLCGHIGYCRRGSWLPRPLCGLLLAPCIWPLIDPLIVQLYMVTLVPISSYTITPQALPFIALCIAGSGTPPVACAPARASLGYRVPDAPGGLSGREACRQGRRTLT